MTIQSGVAKSVRFLVQSGLGTVATGTSTAAQALRRVESLPDLAKNTYESMEKRTDFQVSDFRHGGQRIEGPIRCELSPRTYSEFMENIFRRDFTAVTPMGSLSVTIGTSGSFYTIDRAAGDFLTDGLKVGNVMRLTGTGLGTNNVSKNLLVLDLVGTRATTMVLNGSALTAEGPIAGVTATVTGKKTYVPASGHTNEYLSIEHYYSDLDKSEVFVDCKIGAMNIALPAEGMATVEFGVLGRSVNRLDGASAPYFTAPAAETNTGVIAGVNGALIINGTPVALLSNLSINVNGGLITETVVGSVISPDVFRGRIRVAGEFSAFFEDATLRDIFHDETEASIVAAFTTSNAAAADFISFTLPRVKFGGATKDEPETGIRQRIPYTALYYGSGGTGVKHEQTTIAVQDSAVP